MRLGREENQANLVLPGIVRNLENVSKSMGTNLTEGRLLIPNNTTDAVQNYHSDIRLRKADIDSAVSLLKPNKEEKAIVELYEILMKSGKTVLRRVELPQ